MKTVKSVNEFTPLIEWAVFGHLNRKTDLELILLKGHLIMETVLETVLKRNNSLKISNYSFHKKVLELEKIKCLDHSKKEFIVSSLKEINRLRNKVAHEIHFDIANGELEVWAFDILDNLEGVKFSNYTYRMKIVHSFSVLTKSLLDYFPFSASQTV